MPTSESPAPASPAGSDVPYRRHEIGRGLNRSHYAVVAVSGLVGLFALAALWMNAEAQRRADEARRDATRLWEFNARAARQNRLSRGLGQQRETLGMIRSAAHFHPSRELRDEALSALLLPDLGTNVFWQVEEGFDVALTYDRDLQHGIIHNTRGRALVRRTSDGTALLDTPGLDAYTTFGEFSPDGRLAAVAFCDTKYRTASIGVWEWRSTNLLARLSAVQPIRPGSPQRPVGFAPDGQRLWLLTPAGELSVYDLQTKELQRVIVPGHPAHSLRLSPSGTSVALGCGNILEVWDLTSHAERAALTLTNEIWHLAWQPGEERLAVGCYGGLYLWDIGAPEAVRLPERAPVAITELSFDGDGGFLFSGGWFELGEVWDVRQLQRILEPGAGHLVQLSQDQRRLAIGRERVGYGIRQFLPPRGIRSWPGPVSLGRAGSEADLDPAERWLLTAHTRGWLLRDADSGRELARETCDLVGAASFAADGTNVLAWTSTGLCRWPLVSTADGAVTIGAKRVFDHPKADSFDLPCFSANRRFVAVPFAGAVLVEDTGTPNRRIEIRLLRAEDNIVHLSPDGRWLVTGHNNSPGWDLYDTHSNQFVRRLAPNELAGAMFHPETGQLFTSSTLGWKCWRLPDGAPVQHGDWRNPGLGAGFLGFAPDGRTALVNAPPNALQLFDLTTGRDFATLDFPHPLAMHNVRWSHDGQRLFLFANDGGVTRVDLGVLRHELVALGLNWTDAEPSRESPKLEADARPAANGTTVRTASRDWHHPPHLAWWVAAGLIATVGIGHYVLRYQRRLFAGYLETDALAEERANELRHTHAALAHSEKMKALGTMAAGVAHDFNNLLSVIRLSNDLIEERTPPDPVTRGNFETIHQAVQRGRGLVNSMLGYARDDGQIRRFAPGGLISDAVALLSKPFLSGLVLQIDVAPVLPEVHGRRGRVEQMLLNLVINAAEAMGGQGTLRLDARTRQDAGVCVLPPRAATEFVELTVADDGPGIAADVLPRIFEPFFTTKNQGAQRGTGLGLSMLYAMAQEDGVGVAVESLPGQGTTFRLLLPLDPLVGVTCPSPTNGTELNPAS